MLDEMGRNVGQNVEQEFEPSETLFGFDYSLGSLSQVFPGVISDYF
jgi:hypothetical protein